MPPLHDPPAWYTRSCHAFSQTDAGGELHETPEHGSPLQTPPVQPNEHAVSTGEYVHAPPPQAPGVAQVRAVFPTHVGAGGVLQPAVDDG